MVSWLCTLGNRFRVENNITNVILAKVCPIMEKLPVVVVESYIGRGKSDGMSFQVDRLKELPR